MDTQAYNALTSAQRARDHALRRLGRVRGMAIVGAGALTAGLAGLVSAVAPGRTLTARTKVAAAPRTARPAPPRSSIRALKMPPLASASALGLQAPGAAPQSVAPSDQGAPSGDQGTAAPPQQSAPAPQAAPVTPQPQPVAPQPASGGGGAVSGGS
jgi:DNA polymerase III subunit gamma/tau